MRHASFLSFNKNTSTEKLEAVVNEVQGALKNLEEELQLLANESDRKVKDFKRYGNIEQRLENYSQDLDRLLKPPFRQLISPVAISTQAASILGKRPQPDFDDPDFLINLKPKHLNN